MANMKKTNTSLSRNQTRPGTQLNGAMSSGGSQPPRNMMVVSAHMVTIATYSPSMNKRYGAEEYSTAKPATNSDSASGRSNGGRLVSANAEMKNTMNMGNRTNQFQSSTEPTKPSRVPSPTRCALTISVKLSEPTTSSTVMITKPIETS